MSDPGSSVDGDGNRPREDHQNEPQSARPGAEVPPPPPPPSPPPPPASVEAPPPNPPSADTTTPDHTSAGTASAAAGTAQSADDALACAPASADASTAGGTAGGGRRRGLFVAGLAAALIVLVPGVVFAWRALDGGGPQPHDVLPADALAYGRIDVDPSAGQKVDAARFLDQFPAFENVSGLTEDTDLREFFVDQLTASTGCDLDFNTDVRPWIGDRLGAAMLPPADDDASEPELALALQVQDEEAAAEAFDQLAACADTSGPAGYALLDGYVIIAETAERANHHATRAREEALAQNDKFVEAMDLLGDQGIASVWMSGSAMFDTFEQTSPNVGLGTTNTLADPTAPTPEELRQLVDDAYRSMAVTFRFSDTYAEVASVVTGDLYQAVDGGLTVDVPADTTMMMGLAGADQYVRDNWDTLVDSLGEDAPMLQNMATAMGLTLPDDLGTMVGEQMVLALDASELDLEAMTTMGDMSSLRAGLTVRTDPAEAERIWEQLRAAAEMSDESLDDVPLTVTDDGYVIASDDAYANELTDGGTLADDPSFTTAVKDADDAHSVFFLDATVIHEQLRPVLTAEGADPAVIESLEKLSAVGYSAHLHDGHATATLRLATE